MAETIRRDELLVRLSYVLEFIEPHVRALDRYAPLWREQEPAAERLEDKVVSETALFLLLAHRVADLPDDAARIRDAVTDTLAARIRSPRNRFTVMQNPQSASIFAVGHAMLSAVGRPDPQWDELIFGALDLGYGDMKERVPYRVLDRIWADRVAGRAPAFQEREIMPLSIVNTRAHPLYMSTSDAYALTHTPMYLGDFGRRPVGEWLSQLDAPRVVAVIDAALAWQLLAENFDLLGELLLARALCADLTGPHAGLAWQALCSTWDQLGFVPGPGFEQARFLAAAPAHRAAYAFKELYHTNLVAGILCAVLLTRDEARAVGGARLAPTPSGSEIDLLLGQLDGAIARALAFCDYDPATDAQQPNAAPGDSDDGALDDGSSRAADVLARARACANGDDARVPMWEAALAAAPDSRRDRVGVILDGLLTLAARRYDLGALVRAIDDVVALALPPSSTFVEAVAFLLRQQLPSGEIGAPHASPDCADSRGARRVTLALAACLGRVRNYLFRRGAMQC